MRVKLSEPHLFDDLCAYLGRFGWICAPADADTVNLLVPDAATDLEAELLVLAKIESWKARFPEVTVTVGKFVA